MRKKKYYYCDMDGVLADFFGVPNAVKIFREQENFFFNLKPIEENVQAIVKLLEKGESVRVISASPHEKADKDKRRWLKNIYRK